MRTMSIHQIQVRYEPAADRLLLQVRSSEAELYAVWLTRRMTARLFPPLRDAVMRAGVSQASPQALPVPEAREMLEQAALQRPLPGTEFGTPFTDTGGSHPLGPEPLLPAAIDLRPGPSGGVTIALREDRGRRLELLLTADSTALLRLLDSSLRTADWGSPDWAGRRGVGRHGRGTAGGWRRRPAGKAASAQLSSIERRRDPAAPAPLGSRPAAGSAGLEHQRRQRRFAAGQYTADEQAVVPAICCDTVSHSNTAAQPASTGAPCSPSAQAPSAKRSSAADAKRRDRSTCASASTLTAKRGAVRKASRLGLGSRSDHSTSGGSSESELKELAVRPTKAPASSTQLMMVTPVVKRPSALRRWRRVDRPGHASAVSGVARLDAPARQRRVVGHARVDPARALGRGFLLPERRLRLQVVHQELAGLEGLAAVRRSHRHEHDLLAQRAAARRGARRARRGCRSGACASSIMASMARSVMPG